ncbi:hypothetical protein H2198_008512 [Neophaeococcomyces mojaviensis]|uniref:Uncharacterized protein n=1 Tax=Neophaeococcomyces mojaviensis TaxID=3383035 RepID=A0ACC2ZX32_9EURO|nr:hypothetical protein H2198_008512 [Knufia sp. JES_112]
MFANPEHLPPDWQGRCLQLAKVNYVNFVFSILILIGILVSYLPQHIRIINRRSSFGLSPYFVLLGTTSGTCQFANILTLPGSRADMSCCREVDGFACFAGLLGVMQVGMQWTCFAVILFLFLIYFPRATSGAPNLAKEIDKTPSFRTALIVVWICVIHALVTAIISICFVFARPQHLQNWANFLGILSTVLAVIQYFPQIYTTWVIKRVASLSIPMMCIQTPGSFVWAASLATRLGPSGWSAWGVYCVTGVLQGMLLVMGVYYEWRVRKMEREEIVGRIVQAEAEAERTEEGVNEETPLIREGER